MSTAQTMPECVVWAWYIFLLFFLSLTPATLVFTTNNVPHTTRSPPTSHFHHINCPNERSSVVWACIYFFWCFFFFFIVNPSHLSSHHQPHNPLEIVARCDIYDMRPCFLFASKGTGSRIRWLYSRGYTRSYHMPTRPSKMGADHSGLPYLVPTTYTVLFVFTNIRLYRIIDG